MIVQKKEANFKTLAMALFLFGFAAIVDFKKQGQNSLNEEARILGTGTVVTYGSCIEGTRAVTSRFTILWVTVGGSSTRYEAC